MQYNGGPTYTHALRVGSLAIDTGNIDTCLATDQRGVKRPQGVTCDIGAFEYTPPGPPETIKVTSGTPQSARIFQVFPVLLQVVVIDNDGIPVNNIDVTFSAPDSGASGSFMAGNVTAIESTDEQGIAKVVLKANLITGSYTVLATVNGIATPAEFSLTNTAFTPNPLVETYTSNHTSSLPGTLLCDQTQPTCPSGDNQAKKAHIYATGVYNLIQRQIQSQQHRQ